MFAVLLSFMRTARVMLRQSGLASEDLLIALSAVGDVVMIVRYVLDGQFAQVVVLSLVSHFLTRIALDHDVSKFVLFRSEAFICIIVSWYAL